MHKTLISFSCKNQVIKSLRKFIVYERQEGLRKNAPTVIISASVSLFKSFFLTIVKWRNVKICLSLWQTTFSDFFFSESKGIWFGYSFKPDIKSWNESELNWFTFIIATAVKELISPLFLFRLKIENFMFRPFNLILHVSTNAWHLLKSLIF